MQLKRNRQPHATLNIHIHRSEISPTSSVRTNVLCVLVHVAVLLN